MKINEVQEKLDALVQYYTCHTYYGLDEDYLEAIRIASLVLGVIPAIKEDIEILTECSCSQHPMCNCCDDHACYILGDTVIGMIDKALKESDIEI